MSNFQLHDPTEIISSVGHEPKPLSSYVRKRLLLLDENIPSILNDMQRLVGCHLSAEVVFCNDDGRELYTEFPELANQYVSVADDGQGNSWLLGIKDGQIYFFDHEKEEYPLTPMGIDFRMLLQLADLIAQWERFISTTKVIPVHEQALLSKMQMIHERLPELYPFRLY